MGFIRAAPVFPVGHLDRAVEHYRKLGFAVERHTSGVYAFAEREGVEIHLALVAGLRPRRNTAAAYVYVDDADALYTEWSRAGTDARLVAPIDTDYGMREGACLDRDANLIRFGSAPRQRG